MSYLERIRACNTFNSQHYYPWLIDGQVYGQIEPTFAKQLQRWPQVFQFTEQGIKLDAGLVGYQQRCVVLSDIISQLHAEGVIDSWVGEDYPVTLSFAAEPVLAMERAAANFFGLRSFGIHVNGLVQRADGVHVWVGTRTLSKPFWPGKLDQMVAGGQPLGISLLDNVVKESGEEAGIPEALARQAQAVGQVTYYQSGQRGLDNSTIFIYDLWLADDFVPQNKDGEVSHFQCLPLVEIARLTEQTTEFKDNCNLVNIDLLIRQGWISNQTPDYQAIKAALYTKGIA